MPILLYNHQPVLPSLSPAACGLFPLLPTYVHLGFVQFVIVLPQFRILAGDESWCQSIVMHALVRCLTAELEVPGNGFYQVTQNCFWKCYIFQTCMVLWASSISDSKSLIERSSWPRFSESLIASSSVLSRSRSTWCSIRAVSHPLHARRNVSNIQTYLIQCFLQGRAIFFQSNSTSLGFSFFRVELSDCPL